MRMAVEVALHAGAPVIIRFGGGVGLAALATALGMMLVERHRTTMRANPRALQDELRQLQGALEDGVTGAVEGMPPGRVP
jgi:molybdenum-dependent DNA-binding transcriptional regulator ModE